jgi:hypothetical protein
VERKDMGNDILYIDNYQPRQSLSNIKIDGKHVRSNKQLQQVLQIELEDLLMHLFPQTQAIMIGPMKFGFSGAGVVVAQPIYEQGAGSKVVVKFGDVHQIESEHANYINYVKRFIGGKYSTVILDKFYMNKLGGVVYNFLGGTIDYMQDFSDFYNETDISQIKQALDYLFRSACGLWYASATPLQPLKLTELYQQQFPHSLKQLENIVSKYLPSVLRQKTLAFSSLESTSAPNFTNPLHALKNAQPFICLSYLTITHGDLNKRNIFLDSNGRTYLIDFGRTGVNHILRDVAMLDTVIRFQLLAGHEATLAERLQMEECLCSINRFSEIEQLANGFSTMNPALAKAFATIVHLRTLAGWMVDRKPEDDMRDFYIALLYNTLNTSRFSSLEVEQREHALLSASLIVDHLGIGNNER